MAICQNGHYKNCNILYIVYITVYLYTTGSVTRMIILVLVMVNQSVLQLSQNLATQGCAFSQSPAVWTSWSLWSDNYFMVPTSSEFFIAFIVEDLAVGQCLLLGDCKSPEHSTPLRESGRTLWELQFYKVVLNGKRTLGPDKRNWVVSFQFSALGKTTFQVMLRRMTVSTDKYCIRYHSSFWSSLNPFLQTIMLTTTFLCAGIQCDCTSAYKSWIIL